MVQQLLLLISIRVVVLLVELHEVLFEGSVACSISLSRELLQQV